MVGGEYGAWVPAVVPVAFVCKFGGAPLAHQLYLEVAAPTLVSRIV